MTSAHFVLWTDASAQRGRDLVREMEHRRKIVLGAALDNADPPVKSFVVALRDAAEVGAYVPYPFWARASGPANPARESVIVVSAEVESRANEKVTHEVTHVIMWAAIPNQPDWLSEGLAGFFQSARVDPSGQTVDIGEPPDSAQSWLRHQGATPTADLLDCNRCMVDINMFYATTWAMVAYLFNERPLEFRRYLQRLIELPKGGDQTRAWHEVFPDLSAGDFDGVLAQWLKTGNLIVRHYKVTRQEWQVRERTLADGDVLAARGLLGFLAANDATDTRADVIAALAIDHTNVLARLVETSIKRSIAVEDARATVAAHPDDWRAWWLIWFATKQGPEAKAAHEKLCSLIGSESPSQSELCGPSAGAEPKLPE